MSKYILIFVTSDNCGHCQQSRGTGILNNGKVLVGTNFLKQLTYFNIEIVNVHYVNMMAKKSNIKDISKFYQKGDNIIQEKYYQENSLSKLDVYSSDKGKQFNDYITENNVKVPWQKFLKERISDKLVNYIYFFPCYMILEKENWSKTLTDPKEELVALTNAGYTYKDKYGNIGLKKTAQSVNQNTIDIIKLIEGVTSGSIKIEPKENEEESTELKTKENRKVKMKEKDIKMENFIDYKDIIIKDYDDY